MSQPRVLLLDENKGFGGAERHLLTLGQELDSREVLASLVGRKDSWLSGACGNLPFSPCGFRNEVDMFSVFTIYKLLKSSQANILHCIAHRDLVAAALARQLPGAPRTVLVKAEHSFPDSELSPLFRWAYRQCDALVAVSQAMQRAVQQKLLKDNGWNGLLKVIPNGIPLAVPATAPRPDREQQRYKVGVLSALRPGKGHQDFLEALAACPPGESEKMELSVAGDGPLRAELEARSSELSLDIAFLGHQDQPDAYLRTLDLCVLPSHTETFSLVALECLTLGVPLLAADSEGVTELYPHPEKLYAKGAASQLATRLRAFLDDPSSFRKQAQELSERYRVEYSAEKMGSSYLEVYETLLANLKAPSEPRA